MNDRQQRMTDREERQWKEEQKRSRMGNKDGKEATKMNQRGKRENEMTACQVVERHKGGEHVSLHETSLQPDSNLCSAAVHIYGNGMCECRGLSCGKIL